MSKRVLAIATSDDSRLKKHRTGLWLSELTHFLAVVCDAGFDYDVASPRGGKIPLDEGSATAKACADPVNARFLRDPEFQRQLESSLACRDVEPSRYAAIYLAGGHGTMFDFRQSPDLQRLLTAFSDGERFITGVCHGVAGLVGAVDSSGRLIVKGKRVTGFSNFEDTLAGSKPFLPYLLEDALKECGASYGKNLLPFTERVEVDGKLITGQNPQSAKAVGVALVKELGG